MGDDLIEKALDVLEPPSPEDYRATPEEFEKYRRQALEEVAGLCGGEEAIAAANFRPSGPGGKAKPRKFGDGLAGLGLGSLVRRSAGLLHREGPGQLPTTLLLAVTAKRLYAFDASYRYSPRKRTRESGRPVEVKVWDRAAVRVEAGKPRPLSTLRIEPLDGGPTVILAGPSTVDDPWSLAVMALLDPSPTAEVD